MSAITNSPIIGKTDTVVINNSFTIPSNTYSQIIFNGTGGTITLPPINTIISGQNINILNIGTGDVNIYSADLIRVDFTTFTNNYMLVPDGSVNLIPNAESNTWYVLVMGGSNIPPDVSKAVDTVNVDVIKKYTTANINILAPLTTSNNIELTNGNVNKDILDVGTEMTSTAIDTGNLNVTNLISVIDNTAVPRIIMTAGGSTQAENLIINDLTPTTKITATGATGVIQHTNLNINNNITAGNSNITATAINLQDNAGVTRVPFTDTINSKYLYIYNGTGNRITVDGSVTANNIVARNVALNGTGGSNVVLDTNYTSAPAVVFKDKIRLGSLASSNATIQIGGSQNGENTASNCVCIGYRSLVQANGKKDSVCLGPNGLVYSSAGDIWTHVGGNGDAFTGNGTSTGLGSGNLRSTTPVNGVCLVGNSIGINSGVNDGTVIRPIRAVTATSNVVYNVTTGEIRMDTTSSDSRIKKNIENLNDAECLNAVKNIQPKKYNYIDNHISEKVYGFIAQQVEENLPYAVNTYTDFIPNIYQELNYEIIEETEIVPNVYDYLLYLPILSEVNDVLRFIYDENPHEALVLEKLTDKIKVSVTHIKKLSGTIFVYGKKVDDFKSLLKESLYPVLWSAIQKIQLQNMEMMTKLQIS